MSLTKIGSIGINTGIQFAGVTTVSTLHVGSGVTLSSDGDGFFTGIITATFAGDGTNLTGVASTDNIRTNTNATFLQNINVSGTVTATSYAGDGSALTGIDATQIVTGNTSVQTVDTGSDGHVKVNTEGSERLRIIADGKVGVNKTAPNFHLDVAGNIGLTEGQVITWHDGSGTKAGDMYIDSSDNFIKYIRLHRKNKNRKIN